MRCDVRIKGQQEGRNGGLQPGTQVAIETQDDEKRHENVTELENIMLKNAALVVRIGVDTAHTLVI